MQTAAGGQEKNSKKRIDGDRNMDSTPHRETDGVQSALYLTVDVGAGVQKHLDHGLVPAHAGVHERGHSLWGEQAEEESSLFQRIKVSERTLNQPEYVKPANRPAVEEEAAQRWSANFSFQPHRLFCPHDPPDRVYYDCFLPLGKRARLQLHALTAAALPRAKNVQIFKKKPSVFPIFIHQSG